MKKTITTVLFLLVTVCQVLLSQNMNKQETLDYILNVYRTSNRFYLTENTYMNVPQEIESIRLNFDQLVIYYKTKEYTGPRSAAIYGELYLDEHENGIKNSDNDWVLRVQSQNTSELKRLFYALKHLQRFIDNDPFADKVSDYDKRKKQEEEEKMRQEQYQRMQLAQQRDEQRRLERQQAVEQQRRQAEQQRREQERAEREAMRTLQNAMNQMLYGGH